MCFMVVVFFFKQKTAYELRISDWSSDVCSSDLLDPARIGGLVTSALSGCDDGELYLQYAASESFGFDDGRLKNASFDTQQGFGLRGLSGETTGFAHANELSEAAIRRAAETVKLVAQGHGGKIGRAHV